MKTTADDKVDQACPAPGDQDTHCRPSARHRPRPVYVDEAVVPFRGLLMAHMFSRDFDALHAMAERLGVRPWFQDPATMAVSWPHYDISAATRDKALALGAVAVNKYQMLVMARHIAGLPQQQVRFQPMAAALEWLRGELASLPDDWAG